MNVFLQHFTCFSHVFVNLDRVKISQIPYKSYICQSFRQYLLSDSCSNKESDTREFGLSHSCAASQLAVGFGWSVPLRGTYGEMGGLLCPTAALLRSLQWVSDSRSRVAEHRGRWEGCYAPQRRCFAACSGFRTVGPASRNLGGRWEGCYAPQLRCFAACSGFRMVGPATRNLWGDGRFAYTHSGAASQLAVGFRGSVPRRGTYGEMGGLLCHVCAALCHV